MNLTLAVDEETVEKAREVARHQGTSLNALIRAYIEELAGRSASAEALARMRAHWKNDPPPNPEPGWKFNREEIYAERLDRYGKKRDD